MPDPSQGERSAPASPLGTPPAEDVAYPAAEDFAACWASKCADLARETRRSSALYAIADRLVGGWEADLTESVPQSWRWRQGDQEEPADPDQIPELWTLYFGDQADASSEGARHD